MSLPASVTPITVTGTYLKPSGLPESGTIKFRTALVTLSSGDNTVISVGPLNIDLDSNGQFSIDLIPTDDPDWFPQGWQYYIIEDLSGRGGRRGYFELPYDTAGFVLDIADISLIIPEEGGAVPSNTYIPLAQKGHINGVATLGSDGKVPEAQLPVGSGGSGVDSVNSHTGTVVLTYTDVGAAPASGSANYAPATGSTNYIASTARGAANGVASLDGTGKVPSAQLPASASGVDSVNGHSGTVVLTFSDVDALSDSDVIDEALIPRQLEVAEAQSMIIDRPDPLVNPGTAGDMFKCVIEGRRTGYFNEEGYIRSRSRNDNDVSARFQGYENAESTSPTTSVLEITNSDNSLVHFKVTNGGTATVRTSLAVTTSLTVGTTAAITGNLSAANFGGSGWQAVSAGTNVSVAGTGGYGPVQVYKDKATNLIHCRGRGEATGVVATNGVIFTIPSGYRPAYTIDQIVRQTNTGATNLILTYNTDGTVILPAGAASGARWDITGMCFSIDA